MKIDKISPSSLNKFRICPFWWYCEQKGFPGIPVDDRAAQLGRAIHNCVLIYYSKIPSHPTENGIEKIAREAFKDGAVPIMKSMRSKTNRILKNFIEFEKKRLRTWSQYKPTFVEKSFEAKVFEDIPKLKGIIDFYSKEEATIIDWKTGQGSWTDSNARQGKIYELLLRKHGYPVKRIYFFNLNTERFIQVPSVTDGWIYRELKAMVDMVENNRFPARKSGICDYCPYILECEFRYNCIWEDLL